MIAKFFALCSFTLPIVLLGEIQQDYKFYLQTKERNNKIEILPDFIGARVKATDESKREAQQILQEQSESQDQTQDQTQVQTQAKSQEVVIIPDLKGIVLYGNAADVNSVDVSTVQGLVVKGLDVPGGVDGLKKVLDPIFLHKPLTQKLLQDIKQAIVQYYIDNRQPLMVVNVPEQNVSKGVLQLVVHRSKLGEIRAKGHKYFTSEQLIRYIDLQKGDAIDYDVLLSGVDWMNRSPFRRTELYLTPGIFPGTTNVELLTTDRRPVDVYVGADNTGIKQTGYNRVYGGINATNLFGLDHILNYQYTMSPRWPRYQANVLNYTIPLPWKHIFIFTFGYEKTFPAIRQFNALTRSIESNLRYIMPINPTYKKFMQEVVVGADFQDNNYKLKFKPADFVIKNRAVMTQVMGGYNFSYQFPSDKMVFSAELFYSPGSWLPDQSNATYRRSRPFSNHTYAYGKIYLENTHRFKNNFRIMGRIKGQLTYVNLLFHQYTLGDYYSVRGYKNQFGVDNAFVLNTEVQTPEIKFRKDERGQYFFLFFFDYAIGGDHRPIPTEPRTVYLMSMGPGFRFQIDPHVWARLDLGFPLHRLPPFYQIVTQHYNPWLQFGLFVKF